MLKRLIAFFLAVTIISPVPVFSQQTDDKRKTFEELAKDLAEFNKLVIQFQKELEKMTPEERKQWCINMQGKMMENPPPILIQLNCEN